MSDLFNLGEPSTQAQLPLMLDYPPVKDVPTLRKPVPVVHIYPVNGEYDLYTRRVFNALLVQSYKTWSTMSVELQAQYLAERRVLRFRSLVSDIRKGLGKSSKSNRRVVQAVRRLYRLEFRFDVMGDDGGSWNMETRLIYQFGKRGDAVTAAGLPVPLADDAEDEDPELVKEICWEFPPDVFAMLVSRRVYAAIDLSLANSWKSQFTLALYENTYRYCNNPTRLTARLPVETWMTLLSNGSPALARYKAPGGFRYFVREVLKPAMDEMRQSEICPIEVEPLKGWVGKRVATLQFRVVDKKVSTSEVARELEELQPENPELVRRLRELGLAEDAVKTTLRGNEEDVWRALRITEKAMKKGDGAVQNPAGYFRKALEQQFQETESPEDVAARQQKEREASQKAQAQREALELAYREHRGACTRHQFNAMALVTREALLDKFKTTDEGQRVQSRDFESAVFQGSFFDWLARQKGILTRPEEQSVEAFAKWTAAKRKPDRGS